MVSTSPRHHRRTGDGRTASAKPIVAIAAVVAFSFAAIAAQVLRMAAFGPPTTPRVQLAEPLVRSYARPDILDRKGRVLATDLITHSLFADPTQIIDVDETSERVAAVLGDIDRAQLRTSLADKTRRFVWIKRHLGPADAQRVHDLGLPGLAFRSEPRRVYPQGRMAGHVLGFVDTDNRGIAGIERHIDETLGLESGYSADFAKLPLTLTLDIGAQYALQDELGKALAKYRASGAAGVILDATSGAVLAAASLPDFDPARPSDSQSADRIDRLSLATFELGSVMKLFTAAMALDAGLATPSTVLDVRIPLQIGRWTIRDMFRSGRPLTVREMLVLSSNIGASQLALRAGAPRQRAFLKKIGLIDQIRLETGPLAMPRTPARWGEIETATISYGYGMAVAPMQVAAATAAIVNGGTRVHPHLLAAGQKDKDDAADKQVVSSATSAAMREMLRRVVSESKGTGRRADVPGFEVGGKTGTAEQSVRGGYAEKSVIATFIGAFPMKAPRYVVLVSLFEPQPDPADRAGHITAGTNAAPLAASVIARTAALLGVAPH